MINIPKTIEWVNGKVRIINQLKLPYSLEFIETDNYRRIAEAIKKMEIRGAPAIGVAAAFGVALATNSLKVNELKKAKNKLYKVIDVLKKTRPTAINLFWSLKRLKKIVDSANSIEELKANIVNEALLIAKEDEEMNKKIGDIGEVLIEDGDTIITVCNAGSLATSYYGTVTAPLYTAFEAGKKFSVIAMETRPYLQGARLTAFELSQAGIPVKVITDNSIGIIAFKEKIDLAFVGADRITLDGYVVNKIGTYPLALVSKEHSIPFYVIAPTSSIDRERSIDHIVIEKRPSDEVVYFNGKRITPQNVEAIYYAFDITPPKFVTGIITEKGIAYPPFRKSIRNLLDDKSF